MNAFLRKLALCTLASLALNITPLRAADPLAIDITYLGRATEAVIPLSLIDLPIENNGVLGAELGLADSQTTGSFLNHQYQLNTVMVDESEDLVARYKQLLEDGARLFIVDLNVDDLVSIEAIEPEALLFSVRAKEDTLRNELCHSSVFHFPPSRAMEADGLMQYLAWKRWNKLVLVTGRHEADKLFAAALERAIPRFGLKLVESKDWTAVPGARRTDSGHHSLQKEVPIFARFKDHDVVLVADEADEFGEYFAYRTDEPRPIAGTQGLLPTAWHRTQEQWGATQIQRRFTKLAGRFMSERDYAAWLAMRTYSEAVTNTSSVETSTIREFILSDKFTLAGFKGVPLTFRKWNGQLRQPILVVGARMLVTVSPQDGFLHQYSELDTLGYDEPESGCKDF